MNKELKAWRSMYERRMQSMNQSDAYTRKKKLDSAERWRLMREKQQKSLQLRLW